MAPHYMAEPRAGLAGTFGDVERNRQCCSSELVRQRALPAWQAFEDMECEGRELQGARIGNVHGRASLGSRGFAQVHAHAQDHDDDHDHERPNVLLTGIPIQLGP